jgi:carnitine-CoA ligase
MTARTIGQALRDRASAAPHDVVVRFDDGQRTYGAWFDRAARAGSALRSLGLDAGETCAVLLGNGPEFLDTWFGISIAGLVEVPLNTALKGDLLAYQLRQARCRAIVVDAGLLPRVAQVAVDLPELLHVVVVGAADPAEVPGAAIHDLEALIGAHEPMSPAEPDPHGAAGILFTSGTTGPSKGVVRSHVADFTLARTTIDIMGYRPGDVLYTAFPLFHLNAKFNSVLAAMLVEGSVVLHSRFSASTFWRTCREHGVTAFNFMGALLTMLMKQPASPDDRDHRVRCAYGAPAPVAIYDEFERRFGVKLVEVYGSTELGITTMNTVDRFRVGSCGTAAPYYEVAILDERDRPCPPGVEGEICVRPRRPSVMFTEYYGMPDATVRAFRNLWFHSGDRGRVDDDGCFWYVDRMKDAIRRRGENISSWEVEQVLLAHDAIAEAAVVGVPSELTEEEVLAVVVRKPDRPLSPEELLDHCQERLPHFAVPRYVRFTDALPRTPSQRVEKYRLREEGLTTDAWDREAHGYEVQR